MGLSLPPDPWMTWPEAVERVHEVAPDMDPVKVLYRLLEAGEATARWEVEHGQEILFKPAEPDHWRRGMNVPTDLINRAPYFDHQTGNGSYGINYTTFRPTPARIMVERRSLENALKRRGKSKSNSSQKRTTAKSIKVAREMIAAKFEGKTVNSCPIRKEVEADVVERLMDMGLEINPTQLDRAWREGAPDWVKNRRGRPKKP